MRRKARGLYRRWWRALNRARPRALILLYHRVADLPSDPHLLCVTRAHFAQHLEHLRRRYHPISLGELECARRGGSIPDRAIALTFDDGYADNLSNAKPLLEKSGIPATVFVTTGYVEQQREFWWDELERILLTAQRVPERLELDVAGMAAVRPMAEVEERRAAYDAIHAALRNAGPDVCGAVLSSLRHWAGDDGRTRPTHRPLSIDELQALGGDGLVEIGAHTRSHVNLAHQPAALQTQEIAGSARDLENWMGHPPNKFSYPYGSPGDYSCATVKAVRAAGFEVACANHPEWVTRSSNPYRLPRYLVRDWDADTFASFLEAWFRG